MRTARRPRPIAPAALLPFLIACGGDGSAPTEPADPRAAVRRTLQRMVFVMERNSINRLTIDWPAFADSVYAAAPEARTIWQAEPAIRTALRLLGDGHSFFVLPNGASVFVLRGSVLARGSSPYALRRPRPRVAVLVDNAVASSGEATFIAFRRRPDTRSFGQPTCGLSTANSPFEFDGGSRLLLTVSTMADRERTLFGDQIVPDEVIAGDAAVVARAIAWLRGS